MSVLKTFEKIWAILDTDEPVSQIQNIEKYLKMVKRGTAKGVDDLNLQDTILSYVDTWLEEGAIEEDIDSFIEETADILDALEENEEMTDDDYEDEY